MDNSEYHQKRKFDTLHLVLTSIIIFLLTAIAGVALWIYRPSDNSDAAISGFADIQQEPDDYAPEGYCYICTGKSSKRWHLRKGCKGLSSCGGDIAEVIIDEAEYDYNRTPCSKCVSNSYIQSHY